jgi:hypothetical protein
MLAKILVRIPERILVRIPERILVKILATLGKTQ